MATTGWPRGAVRIAGTSCLKKYGAAHVQTFRSADDPNVTALIIAVNDMDALQAMLESEEGQATAAEDGVDMESMSVLMESE